MSALILDAGAFIAVDRNDRSMLARLRVAHQRGQELRTSAVVIAQVWRNQGDRQALLAALLRGVNVRAVDEMMGREAGELLARAGTRDPIDATVVLIAASGDQILTSDPNDILHLAANSGRQVSVVPC